MIDLYRGEKNAKALEGITGYILSNSSGALVGSSSVDSYPLVYIWQYSAIPPGGQGGFGFGRKIGLKVL